MVTSTQPVLHPKVKHNNSPIVVGILLMLVALGVGYLLVTTTTTSPEARNPLAVNPELKLVSLYKGVISEPVLAENPELIIMQHITEIQAAKAGRNALAENPELTAVQRYATSVSKDTPRNVLAVNPELSCYYRYANK